jgi:adenylate kinase family enzyme
MRKIAIVASASGNGKTTLGRELARRLEVPFVELDALVHGPGWVETPDETLRAQLEPVLALDAWVIDGTYRRKIGDLVLESADLVVWLDLPLHIWLPRLARRTWRRYRRQEELWNGNRETLRDALFGWDSLIIYALRMHYRRRREWPVELRAFPVLRLRTVGEVDAFLASGGQAAHRSTARSMKPRAAGESERS